jgi:hypothetical protein
MTRAKRYLLILATTLAAAAAALGVLVFLGSRDEPPPDTNDLAVARLNIPPEQNGITYLAEAGRLVRGFPDEKEKVTYPIFDWPAIALEKPLAENSEALVLIEKAEACPYFQVRTAPLVLHCGVDDDSVAISRLAPLMQARAVARFRAGQEKEAFDDLVRMMRLGGRLESAPLYLGGLVQRLMALESIRKLLPQSHLESEQLRQLAANIHSAGPKPEALADVIRKAYLSQASLLDAIASGQIQHGSLGPNNWLGMDPTGNYLFQANATKKKYAEAARAFISSLKPPAPEGSQRRRAVEEQFRSEKKVYQSVLFEYFPLPNATGQSLCILMVPYWAAMTRQYEMALADVEMTQTLVALRAFQIDHGDLPAALTDLVPAYLDTLPVDPFDGKPLRYSREKRIVYTVGKDLEDGGGMTMDEAWAWAKEHWPEYNEKDPDRLPLRYEWPDPSLPIEWE